jgi:hypothetical protein
VRPLDLDRPIQRRSQSVPNFRLLAWLDGREAEPKSKANYLAPSRSSGKERIVEKSTLSSAPATAEVALTSMPL